MLLIGLFFFNFFSISYGIKLFEWVSGSNTEDPDAVYGTKTVFDIGNVPQGRAGHFGVEIPLTNEGIMFAGRAHDQDEGETCELNDLWKWKVDGNPPASFTMSWGWFAGGEDCQTSGVYTPAGEFSPDVVPGGRSYVSGTFLADDTTLFTFGGFGYAAGSTEGFLQDVWEFDTTSNEWKFTSGSQDIDQIANYGEMGVPLDTNIPGSRTYSNIMRISDTKLLLLFGWGYDESNDGFLSDIWEFDLSTYLWTWQSGHAKIDQAGKYGGLQVWSGVTQPGGRCNYISWLLPDDEVLVFGGYGYDGYGNHGYLSDLMKYDPQQTLWMWLGGYRENGKKGDHGILHHYDFPVLPGARRGAAGFHSDTNQVSLFGGYGVDGHGNEGYLNDVFEYNYEINQWKWVTGSDQALADGAWELYNMTLYTIASSRSDPACFYYSNRTSFCFGGYGKDVDSNYGRLNDMWMVSVEKYCEYGSTEEDVCSGNGNCLPDLTCNCSVGYHDNDCGITECHGYLSNETDVCSNHGICIEYNNCECVTGYTVEDDCSAWECFGVPHDDVTGEVCNGGECIELDECICADKWFGKKCKTPSCFGDVQNSSSVCGGLGYCSGIDTCTDCHVMEKVKGIMTRIPLYGAECQERVGQTGMFKYHLTKAAKERKLVIDYSLGVEHVPESWKNTPSGDNDDANDDNDDDDDRRDVEQQENMWEFNCEDIVDPAWMASSVKSTARCLFQHTVVDVVALIILDTGGGMMFNTADVLELIPVTSVDEAERAEVLITAQYETDDDTPAALKVWRGYWPLIVFVPLCACLIFGSIAAMVVAVLLRSGIKKLKKDSKELDDLDEVLKGEKDDSSELTPAVDKKEQDMTQVKI